MKLLSKRVNELNDDEESLLVFAKTWLGVHLSKIVVSRCSVKMMAIEIPNV
jgi:hypothetical protein